MNATNNTIIVIAIIVLVVAVVAGLTALLEWAWNFVMAGVFHLPTLGFWGAFALMLVVSLLFGWGRNSVK